MSRLFVVCGMPGSGKTTLARALSRELNIVCLYKDAIKENLYDILEMQSLDDSKRVGFHSIKLLYRLAEELVANGVDLIIESPFSFDDDIEVLKRLQSEYEIELHCLVCEIEEELRLKRFVERPRHKAHHDQERLKVDAGNKDWSYQKPFDFSRLPGNLIRIKTDQPAEVLVEKIKTAISQK